MTYLSKILSYELERNHIFVQTVTPNMVDTKLAANLRQAAMIVSARDFVRYALRTIGTESITSAHPKHKVINHLFGVTRYLLGYSIFMRLMLWAGESYRRRWMLTHPDDNTLPKKKETDESDFEPAARK